MVETSTTSMKGGRRNIIQKKKFFNTHFFITDSKKRFHRCSIFQIKSDNIAKIIATSRRQQKYS